MSVVSVSIAVSGVPMFVPAVVFSAISGVVFSPVLNTGVLFGISAIAVSGKSVDFVMA